MANNHPLLDASGNPFPYQPPVVLCGCSECVREDRENRGIAVVNPKPKTPIRLMGY